MKTKALFFEGGDSVGKNDLVRGVIKYILLAVPDKKILFMNFPQYWFFGHDVRLMLRGACDAILEGNSGIENAYLRSALFGMDRDIALLLAEPLLRKDPNLLVLSDRGPFSSCVTMGYLWANGFITKENLEKDIVPRMFEEADYGLLNYFDHTSLVCTVEGGYANSGLANRKALDKNEAELPQIHAYKVYDMLQLPQIITKTTQGWKDRVELAQEALVMAGYEDIAKIPIDKRAFADDHLVTDAEKSGRLHLIGPETLLRHFGYWSKVDTKMKKMIERWTELSLLPFEGSSKDRKVILDDLETKIALGIKRLTGGFSYLTTPRAPQSRFAIAMLLQKHPVIIDLLKHTSGKRMTTFFQGILAPEQLKLID